MITQRYRKDYTGEFVVTNTLWSGGKKRMQREWVPNLIENKHISGRAVCIGSTVGMAKFDFKILQHHKGGLLGSKKVQTYGIGDIAKLMRLDFTVEKDDTVLKDLIDQHYYKDNVIYTTPKLCLTYPNVFYNVPYNPSFIKQVLAVYLAAFDEHREIFLIGYNDDAELGSNNWAEQLNQIIAAYPATKFFHIGSKVQTPDAWKNNSNFKQLTYKEFILYCDI
jgi:hypothetical protein